MHHVNTQCRLVARPVGLPKASDFSVTTEPVRDPEEGEVVVRVRYVSLDPAMRGWMREGKSYVPPVGLGEVMRAGGVGVVAASRDPAVPVGAAVAGNFGVQEVAVCAGAKVRLIDPALAPLPVWLGALGMTGLTAYFGLLEVGRPRPGDTVVVSAAAGAVGSVAGQIAKLKGCRVIGVAGGPEKCRFVREELGFDGAIDYKTDDLRAALAAHAPQGVDVYFDNVGGLVLDAVLTDLAPRARIVICGAISQYNREGMTRGPSNYLALLVARARMEGFIVFDYADRYDEAIRELAAWRAAGQLEERTAVAPGGVAAFPEALLRLFRGENVGKLVLEIPVS
jgi:NADPH-dependent curcumin reductase CurA